MSSTDSRRTGAPVVLHVTEAFGGGVAAAIHTYAELIPEAEHHVLVRERQDAPLTRGGWRDSFAEVSFLPQGHRAAIRATREHIRQLRPAVVHSHSSYAGFYARMVSQAFPDVRQVYTPHGWGFTRLDKSWAHRGAYWTVEALLSRRTDALAACSPDEESAAPRLGKRMSVTYVPNTAPEDLMQSTEVPAVPAPEGEGLLVVGAGRLGPQKDPEFFAQAIRSVRLAGHQIRAQWVGGGDPEAEQRLRDQGIDVTGWTSPRQTVAMLARADLYLHTARWEGFPLTVLEAHERRVPTVLRDIKSFSEIPWTLKLREPEDLSQAWSELATDFGRAMLLQGADVALAENTRLVQERRLREAYGMLGAVAAESDDERSTVA